MFGPFHVEGSPQVPLGADVANGAPGEPCYVRGQVRALLGDACRADEVLYSSAILKKTGLRLTES